MRSSTVNALRSLIILVSMLALPLAAVVWPKLPQFIEQTLGIDLFQHFGWSPQAARAQTVQATERTRPSVDPLRSGAAGGAHLPEAPPFNPSPHQLDAPAPQDQWEPGRAIPDLAPPAALAPSPTETISPAAAMPRRGRFDPSSWSDPSRRGAAAVARSDAPAPAGPLVPFDRQANQTDPAATVASPAPPHEQSAVGSPPVPAAANGISPELTQMFVELRGLGARHYVLESSGSQGQLFRFQAQLALEGGGNYSQHFEATDASPMAAVARVLGDARAWRQGGTAPVARGQAPGNTLRR